MGLTHEVVPGHLKPGDNLTLPVTDAGKAVKAYWRDDWHPVLVDVVNE
ncbi:hypothetical protein ACFPH6_49890 [Streptomyces xiangluensis]|uniref:Uncharacterized protein n=1 Tax=Streptomyces xiangluensis TaxID=2665720 RepID=A0ABV8Z663_9ACTN